MPASALLQALILPLLMAVFAAAICLSSVARAGVPIGMAVTAALAFIRPSPLQVIGAAEADVAANANTKAALYPKLIFIFSSHSDAMSGGSFHRIVRPGATGTSLIESAP